MASFFHWADYLLCAFSLLISISVGIYYGFNKSKDLGNKAEEFLLGSRNLKTFPVSLSMFVSWLSAIAFIGKLLFIILLYYKYSWLKSFKHYLGSRNLKTFPVSLSMFGSWLSVISLIGKLQFIILLYFFIL